MDTKYGPPYFYLGLAEEEASDSDNRPERNYEETQLEERIGRPITSTERRILIRCGQEELEKVWINAQKVNLHLP